jgi:hypothetical protein
VDFRETVGTTLPDHPRLSGNGGYKGDRIHSPRRRLDGKIIKDRANQRFRKRRAVAEHAIVARLKDHQILYQCRRRGTAIGHAIAGAAALHNLKLDIAA